MDFRKRLAKSNLFTTLTGHRRSKGITVGSHFLNYLLEKPPSLGIPPAGNSPLQCRISLNSEEGALSVVLSHNPTSPGRMLCLYLVTKHQARPKGIKNKLKINQTAVQRKSKQTKKLQKNLKQRPHTVAIKDVLRLEGFHLNLCKDNTI